MNYLIYLVGSAVIGLAIGSFVMSIITHIIRSRQDSKLYQETEKEYKALTPEQKKKVEEKVSKWEESWEANHHF